MYETEIGRTKGEKRQIHKKTKVGDLNNPGSVFGRKLDRKVNKDEVLQKL